MSLFRLPLRRVLVPPSRFVGTRIRYISSVKPVDCQSCSKPLSLGIPACASCWSLQRLPPKATHFDVFGLPTEPYNFRVDKGDLKARFRKAQAACHPDAWASKDPAQHELAQNLSARLNQAYQTLLHPVSRAEYILQLNGIEIAEQDQVLDMEFMETTMEARELIEMADTSDRDKIEGLIEDNQRVMDDTVKHLESQIDQGDWKDAKETTIRLRYLDGIDRAAKEWLHNN